LHSRLDGLKQLVTASAVRRLSMVTGITTANTDGDGLAIALGAGLLIVHPAMSVA
jgi:hypothetical protein